MSIKYGSRVRLGNSIGTVTSVNRDTPTAYVEWDYNGSISEWPIADLHEMNSFTLSIWNDGNEFVDDEYAYLLQLADYITTTWPGTKFKISEA
jgi:hypothetical protein